MGCWFTWTDNQSGEKLIKKKLDRALCNTTWKSKFSKAFVTNLSRVQSDHCSVLLLLSIQKSLAWEVYVKIIVDIGSLGPWVDLAQLGEFGVIKLQSLPAGLPLLLQDDLVGVARPRVVID
ncbi:hypothetical protein QQP08_003903 [Theobroma cacao]|nr:hypothetical protein QQP08_003903 [Theobroma cacao]